MKQIENLRHLIIERVQTCTDASLLDLILKLFPPKSVERAQ